MSTRSRILVVATSMVLGAVTSCSPGGLAGGEPTEPNTPQPKSELAELESCKILNPDEVTKLNLRDPQPETQVSSEPGCSYLGNPFGVVLYKNTAETVESSENKPVWAKFERIRVNGRTAAQTITSGSTKARMCSTMFNAGNGLIDIVVNETNPGDLDECAESHQIAEMIEPRMPE